MRLNGDYDAVQDRILLRLWDDATPSGTMMFWFTRRQWLAIAFACYRVRAAASGKGEVPLRPRENATIKEPARGSNEGGTEAMKARLVSGVKFMRIPSGLRIKMHVQGDTTLFLTVQGDKFTLFTRLVESLATKAKWDLPAAISRMSKGAVTARKRVVH